MDNQRLIQLAGIKQPQHGNIDLFQDSLRIVFGLDPETIETIVSFVRRHGETANIRDQQVRRRAGGRAIQLLKQAHMASAAEGDEHYDEDDPEADPEAYPEADVEANIKEMYDIPVDGQQFGQSDQGEPKDHTPEELSTLADLLHKGTVVGGKKLARDIFKLVPRPMAYEFNHSVWNYKGK